MKNCKKNIVSIIFILLILTLFGCDVNIQNDNYAVAETSATSGFDSSINGFGRAKSKMIMMGLEAPKPEAYDTVNAVEEDVEEVAIADEVESFERKIIKTVDLNTETKEFDASIDWLKMYVSAFNGVIDNVYIDSGNMTNVNHMKNANFTIRVPAEKLNDFLQNLGNKLNIIYQYENVRDVTDIYDDTEMRKNTLILEEVRLNELLAKATSIDDIVKIEEKLSEIRLQLANIAKKLNRLNKQIDYSTITISIVEVKDLSSIVKTNDYSKANIIKMMKKNFEEVKQTIKGIAFGIIIHLPAILAIAFVVVLFLVIFGIIRLMVKGIRNKKNKKSTNDSARVAIKKESVTEPVVVKTVSNTKNTKSRNKKTDIPVLTVKDIKEKIEEVKEASLHEMEKNESKPNKENKENKENKNDAKK